MGESSADRFRLKSNPANGPGGPESLLIRARHVLPIAGPAIRDGSVLVVNGLIAAVGPYGSIESGRSSRLLDLGDALLLPGFVNAHSHVEYTILRGFDDTLELFPWVRKLTALKVQSMSPSDFEVSALLGAVELIRAGVTCTGDCTDNGDAVMAALNASGLRGCAYQEVFGPVEEQCDESLTALLPKLERLQADAVPGRTRAGISPHAPYTVCARLFRETARLSRERGFPLAIHVAESPAEESFIFDGSGPIAEAYAARGLSWKPAGVSPIAYLEGLGLFELGSSLELIHCVRIDSADRERLARSGAGIAHCPRSNAKLGNGIFPAHAIEDPRLRIGLGTDSAASNNALSVAEELRFAALTQRTVAAGVRTVTPDRLLRMATLGSAACLGLESTIGSIEVGKQADLAAFALDTPEQLTLGDPVSALAYGPPLGPARMTMVAGRLLCENGRVTTLDVPALLAEARERMTRLEKQATGYRRQATGET